MSHKYPMTVSPFEPPLCPSQLPCSTQDYTFSWLHLNFLASMPKKN